MSVWSSFEGTVQVPKKCRVGFRELVDNNFYDTGKWSLEEIAEYHSSRTFRFSFSVPWDGLDVQVRLMEFVNKCLDNKMHLDMMASLRFLT